MLPIRSVALTLALALAPAAQAAADPAPAAAAPAPIAAVPASAAPIDPVRLEAAKITVDHVFPVGTYARLMDGTMNTVMSQMADSMGKMPLRDLAAMGGVKEADLTKMGPGTLDEIMAIYDPAYHQRMDIAMRTMLHEMTTLMTQFEPGIREGLSRAYARRFSTEQLGDLNRFFDTPSGGAYARDSMMLFMDPEVMSQIQALMPALMKQMPQIVQKLETATAGLPKPRSYKELTPAERRKLAHLLGTTEAALSARQRR